MHNLIKWSLSFRFFSKSIQFSSYHVCYMNCPQHPWIYHPNNVWWIVQIMKLPIMQFSPSSDYFISLRFKHSPQHPIPNVLKPSVRDQLSYPYKITKITVPHTLIFWFLDRQHEDKKLWTGNIRSMVMCTLVAAPRYWQWPSCPHFHTIIQRLKANSWLHILSYHKLWL